MSNMAKKSIKSNKKQVNIKNSQGIAIAALILNILILPGLGTVIAKQYKIGIWQIVLALISFPLMLVLVGIPIFIATWIWALVTSIKILQDSS